MNSHTTTFISRPKRTKLLSVLTFFLFVLVIPAAVYFSQQQQDFLGRAAGPNTPSSCNHTGVTRNVDGTYSFAWLHVATYGEILDGNNCPVRLLGVNTGKMFIQDASAPSTVGLANLKQQLGINIVRVAINSHWWTTDAYVPKQRMHFKRWLQTAVASIEKTGLYVEFDLDTNFFEQPCGNDQQGTDIRFCPAQNQGEKDYSDPHSPYYHNQAVLQLYQPTAVQALTDLAKLYAHDPGVIFDLWNEPGDYIFIAPGSLQYRFAHMNERINTVRQYDPQALVVVFTAGFTENLSYTQPNLVFDFHVYPNFNGVSPVTGTRCSTGASNFAHLQERITSLHNTGKGALIGEWGGCYDILSYNKQMLAFAQVNDTGMIYFQDGFLGAGTGQLNANGRLVQQDYASIAATPFPPPPNPTLIGVARDTFQRGNQMYWGTASDGNIWRGGPNELSAFSLFGDAGRITGGNSTYNALLGPQITDGEVVMRGSVSSLTGGSLGTVLRYSNKKNWYKAYLDGSSLILTKEVGGVKSVLLAIPFSASANTSYTLRFRVQGNTLYAKAWSSSEAEPANWMVSVADSSLSAGYAGLSVWLGKNVSVAFTFFSGSKM